MLRAVSAETVQNAPVARWLRSGVFATLDQALFAGSNYLIHLLLARWLSPHGYGAFTLVYSIYLMLVAMYLALQLEPMAVFGASDFRASFKPYLRYLLRLHFIISSVCMLLIVGVATLANIVDESTSQLLLMGALVSPFLLLPWLFRRAAYTVEAPHKATQISAAYFGFIVLGMFGLHLYVALDPFWAFGVMGLAATVACLVFRLPGGLDKQLDTSQVWPKHWVYGRWSVLSQLLRWVRMSLFYAALPIFAGIESVGALRALMNLVVPITHINTSVASIALPTYARIFASGSRRDFVSALVKTLILLLTICSIYGILVWFFREDIVHLLYAGKYGDVLDTLPVILAIPVAGAINSTLANGLLAMKQPKLALVSDVIAALIIVIWAFEFLEHGGIASAATGLVVASLSAGLVYAIVLVRRLRSPD
jgi:O-antigen/teichoic acid export membrane protein